MLEIHQFANLVSILPSVPDILPSLTDSSRRYPAVSRLLFTPAKIDVKATSQPWGHYPLYIAARVFGTQMRKVPGLRGSLVVTNLLAGQAARDYQKVAVLLADLENNWTGVRDVQTALLLYMTGLETGK